MQSHHTPIIISVALPLFLKDCNYPKLSPRLQLSPGIESGEQMVLILGLIEGENAKVSKPPIVNWYQIKFEFT